MNHPLSEALNTDLLPEMAQCLKRFNNLANQAGFNNEAFCIAINQMYPDGFNLSIAGGQGAKRYIRETHDDQFVKALLTGEKEEAKVFTVDDVCSRNFTDSIAQGWMPESIS